MASNESVPFGWQTNRPTKVWPLEKINDNKISEEETALLSEGHLEAQQGVKLLTHVLTRLNTNMTAMSESLKRLHDVDKHGDKEADLPRKDHAIPLNQAFSVRLMTCL